MRYVMFSWVDSADAALWDRWSEAEKQADVDRHRDWFGKYHDRIVGGEELEFPRTVKTLRPGRQGEGVVVTDGPYVESKEFLGGFIVLDVADWDEAVAIASEWPSLVSQPNATVSVQRVFERG
jgi:hypothetical protein